MHVATLGQRYEKIGLLYILASGPTACLSVQLSIRGLGVFKLEKVKDA